MRDNRVNQAYNKEVKKLLISKLLKFFMWLYKYFSGKNALFLSFSANYLTTFP